MSSAVKQEFFRWIESLSSSTLTDIDRKLFNLLVTHFDTLAPLTTAKGSSNRDGFAKTNYAACDSKRSFRDQAEQSAADSSRK